MADAAAEVQPIPKVILHPFTSEQASAPTIVPVETYFGTQSSSGWGNAPLQGIFFGAGKSVPFFRLGGW